MGVGAHTREYSVGEARRSVFRAFRGQMKPAGGASRGDAEAGAGEPCFVATVCSDGEEKNEKNRRLGIKTC